jgi:hypothetical protein
MKSLFVSAALLLSVCFAQSTTKKSTYNKKDKVHVIMKWSSAALAVGSFTAFALLPPTVVHRYNYDTKIYGPDRMRWYEDPTRMHFFLLGTSAVCINITLPLYRN